MSTIPANEPTFRESVDLMFNRAVALMDLPPGLEEKIRVCNATYTVRFGVRLRGQIKTFTGYRSVHSEHMEVTIRRVPRLCGLDGALRFVRWFPVPREQFVQA